VQKRQLQVEAVRILDVKWCRSITTDIYLCWLFRLASHLSQPLVQSPLAKVPRLASFDAQNSLHEWLINDTELLQNTAVPRNSQEFLAGHSLLSLARFSSSDRKAMDTGDLEVIWRRVSTVTRCIKMSQVLNLPSYSDGYPMVRFDAGERW